MADYKTGYSELGFYVKGERKSFTNGLYTTDNKDEIAVLDNLSDVIRIEEKKEEATTESTNKPKSRPKK